MIRVALGQVDGWDTRSVIETTLDRCDSQLHGTRPDAGILFVNSDMGHGMVLQAIASRYPDIELVGCTSGGEFSTDLGASDDSVSLMLFQSDAVSFGSGVGQNLRSDPARAIEEAIRQASGKLPAPPKMCFVFAEPFEHSYDPVVQLLNRALPDDVAVIGGCAGTLWEEDLPIRQFRNQEILADAVTVLLLSGGISYSTAVSSSWQPIGRQAMVTETRGRLVTKIDNMNAVDFYRRYIGVHEEPSINYVLAVKDPKSGQFYMREPNEYTLEGGVIFSEVVPQGAVVQLTEADRDAILADTRAASATLHDTYSEGAPAFALAFSCVTRKEILGTNAQEELSMLRSHLPPNLPVLGFHCFGQIGPLSRGQKSRFHTETLVTIMVGPGTGGTPRSAGEKTASGFFTKGQEVDTTDALKREIDFIKRKLSRSVGYRRRLEDMRDFNSTIHRQILKEVQSARQALRKSEEKYRRIVETTSEGFILMDGDLGIADINMGFAQLLGRSRDEIIGRSLYDVMKDSSLLKLNQSESLFSNGYSRAISTNLITREGTSIPVLIHGNTLTADDGEIIGNMAFVTDMTDQKKALQLAGEVQMNMLPGRPLNLGWIEVAGRSLPCDEMGGDYFDYLYNPTDRKKPLIVIVGDITGHGVDAALFMMSSRAFFRMRASRPGILAEVITDMNAHLTMDVSESGRFMTLFGISFDPAKQRLDFLRAGHDPAVLYDLQEDRFTALKGSGIALGIDENMVYDQSRVEGLNRPHIIAAGTDGLSEARNSEGEMYGKERLKYVLRRHANETAQVILDEVFKDVRRFSVGVRQEDDMTLVIMKLAGDEHA